MKNWYWHVLRKPHGYRGDYEIMERLYHADQYPWYAKLALNPKWPAIQAVKERPTMLSQCCESMYDNRGRKLSVLDVGCGNGLIAKHGLYPNIVGHYTGLDHDPNAVMLCRARMQGIFRSSPTVSTAKAPFRGFTSPSKFDIIWMCGLADYLDDRWLTQTIKNLVPRLQRGGRFIIGNLGYHPQKRLMDVFGWKLHYRSEMQLQGVVQRATGLPVHTITKGVQVYSTITR